MAVKIVIIDDPISSPRVLEKTVGIYRICDEEEKHIKVDRLEEPGFDTHSDVCCKIIMKSIKDVEFINIIFKEVCMVGRIDYFVRALQLAARLQPDIVHLSVGTTTFNMFFSLFRAVNELTKRSIVIAAESNDGKLTFPACFPKVFSCKASYSEKKVGKKITINAEQYIRNNYGFIMKIPNDNSFAAAVFSGQMAAELQKSNFSKEKMSEFLK